MNDLNEFKVWVTENYGYKNADYLYCPTFEQCFELWSKVKQSMDSQWISVAERLPEAEPRRQIAITNDSGSWMEFQDSGLFRQRVEDGRKMKMPEFHLCWREVKLPK